MSVLLFSWIIACIWLVARIFSGKRNGFALAITFFSPIVITPLLGLIADSRSSGASDWQLVPGVIAAPAVFFASPFIAYHEFSTTSREEAIQAAIKEFEADPSLFWKEKPYLEPYGTVNNRAGVRYLISISESLAEEEMELIAEDGIIMYLSDPRYSSDFLRKFYENWSKEKPMSRIPIDFVKNTNCPPEILEEILSNRPKYGWAHYRAAEKTMANNAGSANPLPPLAPEDR